MKHVKLFEQFLNEAYGVQAIDKTLKAYADGKKLTFKKVDSKTKPGNYGSSTTFAIYQLGDKFTIVRYEKVAGAPRFNSVKVFITESPTLDSKVIAATEPYSEFDLIRLLDDQKFETGVEVPKTKETAAGWTRQKLDQELRDLKTGARDAGDISDDMAFDVADGWLSDNPGVEVAIKNHYPRVTDFQGFVANWIA